MPTTFTDGKGAVRYVGGGIVPAGKLAAIKAAAAKRKKPVAKKPVVKPKPKPVNPLDAQVNAAITSHTAPLTGMLGERDKQYDAEAELATRANATHQSELGALGGQYNANKTNAIQQVGIGSARTQDEANRASGFLQSVLGGFVSDQGAAANTAQTNQLAAGAAGDLSRRTIAGQLALEQQAGNQSLAVQGGAASQQAAEFTRDALTRQAADKRTVQTQIAAIQAQAPTMRRKFERENEQMRIANEQLALEKAQFGESKSQFDRTLISQEQQAADELALDQKELDGKPKPPSKRGEYGYGAGKDGPINAVLDAIAVKVASGGKLKFDTGTAWGDTFASLRSRANLSTDQAALLASKVYQTSVVKAGADRTLEKLRERKVSATTQKKILEFYFGKGAYAKAAKGGGTKPGLLDGFLGDVAGVKPPMGPPSPKPTTKPLPRPTRAPGGGPILAGYTWRLVNGKWQYGVK